MASGGEETDLLSRLYSLYWEGTEHALDLEGVWSLGDEETRPWLDDLACLVVGGQLHAAYAETLFSEVDWIKAVMLSPSFLDAFTLSYALRVDHRPYSRSEVDVEFPVYFAYMDSQLSIVEVAQSFNSTVNRLQPHMSVRYPFAAQLRARTADLQ